jgi:hypothetical protein
MARQRRPILTGAKPEEFPRPHVEQAVEEERRELAELEAAPVLDPRTDEGAVDPRSHVREVEVRPVVATAVGEEARLVLEGHLKADAQLPIAVGRLQSEPLAFDPRGDRLGSGSGGFATSRAFAACSAGVGGGVTLTVVGSPCVVSCATAGGAAATSVDAATSIVPSLESMSTPHVRTACA